MIRYSHPVLSQIVKTPHSYVKPNKPVHNDMLHLIEARPQYLKQQQAQSSTYLLSE